MQFCWRYQKHRFGLRLVGGFGLWLLGVMGCDAPRLNPFDPRAENYIQKIRTRISVRAMYNPTVGIPGVFLVEEKLNLAGVTDARGEVLWEHDPVDSLIVHARADEFFPATMRVKVQEEANQFTLLLNARPVVARKHFYSFYNVASQKTRLTMEAWIEDRDGPGDIGVVYLALLDTSFRDTLEFYEERYRSSFNISRLPGEVSKEEITGLDFSLVIKNTVRDSIIDHPNTIRRVIAVNLVPLQPNVGRTETGSILFKWEPVNLPYEYFYRIVLVQITPVTQKVGEFAPIAAGESQYKLEDPAVLDRLTDGTYTWVLQVEDRFGNVCQSKALVFDYFKS